MKKTHLFGELYSTIRGDYSFNGLWLTGHIYHWKSTQSVKKRGGWKMILSFWDSDFSGANSRFPKGGVGRPRGINWKPRIFFKHLEETIGKLKGRLRILWQLGNCRVMGVRSCYRGWSKPRKLRRASSRFFGGWKKKHKKIPQIGVCFFNGGLPIIGFSHLSTYNP